MAHFIFTLDTLFPTLISDMEVISFDSILRQLFPENGPWFRLTSFVLAFLPEAVKDAGGSDEQVVRRFARLGQEDVLIECRTILTHGLGILSLPEFPAERIMGLSNRAFKDTEETKSWFLWCLREFQKECLLYAEERKAQNLPVVPLPAGVELPELPEK